LGRTARDFTEYWTHEQQIRDAVGRPGRLCTRGITPALAAERSCAEGDRELTTTALRIVSIIWSPPRAGDPAVP